MDGGENEGVVRVHDFLEKWDGSALSMCSSVSEKNNGDQKEFSATTMTLPAETVEELSKVCGPEKLWCGDEPMDRKLLLNNIPENTGLQTLDYQKMAVRKRAEEGRQTAQRRLRHKKVDTYMLPMRLGNTQDRDEIPPEYQVSCQDVILVVHIYKTMGTFPNHRTMKDQTYLVRGDMPLTSLRDAIRCINDFAVAGDISLNPKECSRLCAKDVCKSAMFFIEKTFYNDMREHDNMDYSQEIREWVRAQNGMVLATADMADTTFRDLDLQLGSHYLYLHQGDCEHMIIFSDLRLIHPTDPQDTRQYPYLLQKSVSRRLVCRSCSTHTASFQVVDSLYAPESPCYMCQDCFLAFHYDENDQKIGNFKAYKYVDASMI